MKEIPLTQGKVAKVDDEDYEYLMQWKWYAHKGKYIFYAARTLHLSKGYANQINKIIRMHRVIMNAPDNMEVDHINGDGLDNRKENLRNVTHSQNQWNRNKYLNNTSGFKGVHWHKRDNCWAVIIRVKSKAIYVGSFDNILDAARAYNKAARKYHGEFACLNKILEKKKEKVAQEA